MLSPGLQSSICPQIKLNSQLSPCAPFQSTLSTKVLNYWAASIRSLLPFCLLVKLGKWRDLHRATPLSPCLHSPGRSENLLAFVGERWATPAKQDQRTLPRTRRLCQHHPADDSAACQLGNRPQQTLEVFPSG